MKSVLMAALLTVPVVAAAAGAKTTAPTPTTAQPVAGFSWPLCLVPDTSSPWCGGSLPGLYSSPNAATSRPVLAGHSSFLSTRNRLTVLFDRGYDTRRQRMQHCLEAPPPRPPLPYHFAAKEAALKTATGPLGRAFFDLDRRGTRNAFNSYNYCVLYGEP